MYLWTNSFNLKSLLLTIAQDAQVKKKPTDNSSQLVAAAWKYLEPIPNMLGDEMAVIVEPGSEDRSLRVPLAVFFFPVIDMDGLKKTIQNILDTHSITVKTGQYGNVEYMQSMQSPQDGLLPLYGFWGDQFFLGNSASLLHKIIDTHDHGFSLLNTDLIKKNNTGLTEPNNLVTYSNNVHLIDTLKDFLNIMGTLVALEDRRLAQKIRLLNDTIVTPLLDGMKMYDTSITRSYFTSEHIVVDVTTTISDHP